MAETGDTAEHPVAETPAAARENGQRFGVRFRRGSRGGLRAGDIPLIGVVQVDAPAPDQPIEAVLVEAAAEPVDQKPARPKRAPRKKKAAAGAAAKAEKPAEPESAPATPVKRGRTRAKKKAE
jgi:hypothetical protein